MSSDNKQKVVFHLSNNDTFIHKSLIRQLFNVMKAIDGVSIEVVSHSYGIDLLLKDSPFKKQIETLEKQGVVFMACSNTLDEERVNASDLLGFVRIIPSGLAHIIIRQSERWGYIKAGF